MGRLWWVAGLIGGTLGAIFFLCSRLSHCSSGEAGRTADDDEMMQTTLAPICPQPLWNEVETGCGCIALVKSAGSTNLTNPCALVYQVQAGESTGAIPRLLASVPHYQDRDSGTSYASHWDTTRRLNTPPSQIDGTLPVDWPVFGKALFLADP